MMTVAQLARLVEEAKEHRRTGRFISMPVDLTAQEVGLILGIALQELSQEER